MASDTRADLDRSCETGQEMNLEGGEERNSKARPEEIERNTQGSDMEDSHWEAKKERRPPMGRERSCSSGSAEGTTPTPSKGAFGKEARSLSDLRVLMGSGRGGTLRSLLERLAVRGPKGMESGRTRKTKIRAARGRWEDLATISGLDQEGIQSRPKEGAAGIRRGGELPLIAHVSLPIAQPEEAPRCDIGTKGTG